MSSLRRTPIYVWHVEHGARMVEFAGWEMPVQYESILEEHHATRRAVGLFDISHMGRLRFSGVHAGSFLDRLLTRQVWGMRPGAVRYSLITRDDGGVLDDVLVYRLLEPAHQYFMVVNAANRGKILAWLESRRCAGEQVTWTDETEQTAMIAVQGPCAIAVMNELLEDFPLEQVRYYHSTPARVAGYNVLLSRTGYTGEDGCELVVSAEDGLPLWELLVHRARRYQGRPAGLGARDTLRLEAGMPLYGHELTEDIDPLEAGLQFAVQCQGRDFPGAAVLRHKQLAGPQRRRVGLAFAGRRIPREGNLVFNGDQQVGYVTSGTFSPTLEHPIAMAYVRPEDAQEGTPLIVEIRGHREPARVVALPFYRRPAT